MHEAKDRPEIASQDLDCEPHSIETEQALLGALLLANGTYHKVSPVAAADDFYEPLHARLFEAIGDLIGEDVPVTPLTLEPFFQGEMVGSLTVLQYLGRLLSAATSIISAEHYA